LSDGKEVNGLRPTRWRGYSVLVNVQVLAGSGEIEDLVDVIVRRLEGAGLVVVEKGMQTGDGPGQRCVELSLRPLVEESTN
jgi:hypothetical protein